MATQGIADLLVQWKNNFKHNITAMATETDLKTWIRIIMVVGTYLLLRPYIIKLGARAQQRTHEKDSADTGAEIHPNDLRGGRKAKVEIPGVGVSDEEEDAEEKPGEWGRKARVRQRKFIRNAVEKEEKRLQEEQEAESDKEIEQFLVD